jgi:hypothetical protein
MLNNHFNVKHRMVLYQYLLLLSSSIVLADVHICIKVDEYDGPLTILISTISRSYTRVHALHYRLVEALINLIFAKSKCTDKLFYTN